MFSKASIGTGVLVESIDESGSFHPQATIVINSITSGRILGLIAHPVLAELYYVSSRLYEKLAKVSRIGEPTPSMKSESLVRWLFNSPNFQVPENGLRLASEAGMMKGKYALALTDSYVLAAAKLNECKAIFKSPEEEMIRGDKLARIKREERIEVVFLDDYS